MKNNLIIILILVGLSVGIFSCEKSDVDDTMPTINVVLPAEHDTLFVGQSLNFKADFSDNVELYSYKIEVHSNFDGHTHSGRIEEEEGHPWSYSETWEFDPGQETASIQHAEISIPETVLGEENTMEPVATGEYHFGVYCIDASGNETQVFVEVYIDK